MICHLYWFLNHSQMNCSLEGYWLALTGLKPPTMAKQGSPVSRKGDAGVRLKMYCWLWGGEQGLWSLQN